MEFKVTFRCMRHKKQSFTIFFILVAFSNFLRLLWATSTSSITGKFLFILVLHSTFDRQKMPSNARRNLFITLLNFQRNIDEIFRSNPRTVSSVLFILDLIVNLWSRCSIRNLFEEFAFSWPITDTKQMFRQIGSGLLNLLRLLFIGRIGNRKCSDQ